jgi:malonate transporter and related proteins
MIDQVPAALLPVILLIGLGMALRRPVLLGPEFWPQAERLCYFVLLPALFFHGLATARLDNLPLLPMAAVLAGGVLIAAALTLALRPVAGTDGAGFTSVFQGSVRFNNFVGITLAAGLLGLEGIALAAVCNAVLVPLVNLLSVAVLARHGPVPMGLRATLRQLATNPLVLACLAGIALRLTGLPLPGPVAATLATLGAGALPLGLLCVGAALRFGGIRGWARPILISAALKLAVLPLVSLGLAIALGLSGTALLVVVAFQALPTATSAYVLARQMGGDAPLMAAIIATQTVAALATLPLTLWALSQVAWN